MTPEYVNNNYWCAKVELDRPATNYTVFFLVLMFFSSAVYLYQVAQIIELNDF